MTGVEIVPSNQLYLDDSFYVNVTFNGNSCKWLVRFTLDNKPFNTSIYLRNGTRYLRCGTSYVDSGVWDLKKQPITPGTHVVKVELYEPGTLSPEWGLLVYEKSSVIIRVYDVSRTTTTTKKTTTTSTSTKTTTSTSTTTSTTTTTIKPIMYLDYEDEVYGFRFTYPDLWKKKEDMSWTVLFLIPFDDEAKIPDIYQERVGVSVQKVASDITLESFTGSLVDSLKSTPGFELVDSRNVTFAEQDAYQIIYKFRMYPLDMRALKVYAIRNDYVYVLTYEAEDKSYSQYVGDFSKLKDSFQITTAATTTTTVTMASTSTTEPTATTTTKPGMYDMLLSQGALIVGVIIALIVIFFVVKQLTRPRKKKPEPPEVRARVVSQEDVSRDEVLNEVLRKTPSVVSEDKPPKKEAVGEPGSVEDEGLRRLKELEEEIVQLEKKTKEDESDSVWDVERFEEGVETSEKKPSKKEKKNEKD